MRRLVHREANRLCPIARSRLVLINGRNRKRVCVLGCAGDAAAAAGASAVTAADRDNDP